MNLIVKTPQLTKLLTSYDTIGSDPYKNGLIKPYMNMVMT